MKTYVLIPEILWREIIDALESANWCDHNNVSRVLEEIEKTEKEEVIKLKE